MKFDIYAEVTERIVAQLEKGVVPWKSPYFSQIGFPKNFASGKEYRGINVFLLGSLRFTSPYFLTFIQARDLGGNIRKGERGSLVVKYGSFTKEDAKTAATDKATQKHRFLKAYTVFNSSQIEGIEFPTLEASPQFTPSDRCNRAREIVAAMPHRPEIKQGSAVPHYLKNTDSVHMPEQCFFSDEEAYYSTLFHELAHSTGHASRLSRKSLVENEGIDATGEARKVYAEEELVAEMSASFLNAHAGIIEAEIENAAAYLQNWISVLKSKDAKSWIVKAASEAQKASDYILNIKAEA